MQTCPHCGFAEVPDGAERCPSCGEPLPLEPVSSPPPDRFSETLWFQEGEEDIEAAILDSDTDVAPGELQERYARPEKVDPEKRARYTLNPDREPED